MVRARVLSHTHGGQIDHVIDEQVAKTSVPRLEKDRIRRIDTAVIKMGAHVSSKSMATQSLTSLVVFKNGARHTQNQPLIEAKHAD